MEYYKNQFIDWLELTWYLISEPWSKLYTIFLDKFAPRWLVTLIVAHRLKHMSQIVDQKIFIEIIENNFQKKKVTRKQADKLIKLVKRLPERTKMKVIVPDEDLIFDGRFKEDKDIN